MPYSCIAKQDNLLNEKNATFIVNASNTTMVISDKSYINGIESFWSSNQKDRILELMEKCDSITIANLFSSPLKFRFD